MLFAFDYFDGACPTAIGLLLACFRLLCSLVPRSDLLLSLAATAASTGYLVFVSCVLSAGFPLRSLHSCAFGLLSFFIS